MIGLLVPRQQRLRALLSAMSPDAETVLAVIESDIGTREIDRPEFIRLLQVMEERMHHRRIEAAVLELDARGLIELVD